MFVDIAQMLKRAKEKGVSASFLCRSVGRDTSYIASIKKHPFEVSSETMKTWANALETTVEYLCGETDDPEIPKEKVADEEIQVALFGGEKATAEEWEEVKKFVAYLKSKRTNNER